STAKALTQILYGFRTREALDLLRLDDPDAATTPAEVNTNEVDNAIPEVNIKTVNAHPVTRSANDAATRSVNNEAATSTRTVNNDTATDTRPVAMDEYRPTHIDAKDAIAFAAMKMKEQYDKYHRLMFFNKGDLVNLRLHRGYHVPGVISKKIG
ncbi:hypothetical protein MMC28_009968, partial [Mycoblastus sanguinarius]|nr:hypothetical protein [Mycoblastus sanguinarius]